MYMQKESDYKKKNMGLMTRAVECSPKKLSPVPDFISPSPCDLDKFLNPYFSQLPTIFRVPSYTKS